MAIDTPHAEWRRDNGVIDMHTHISAEPDHIEQAIRIMDQNNIRKMVDIGGGNTGDRFWEFTDAISDHPDRFATFAGIDFDGFGEDGWLERELEWMEEAVDAGAVGFKIHKSLGLRYTDENDEIIRPHDERLAPIFEKINELDVVQAFHIADPKAFFRPLNEENERWAELGENPQWWFGDREKYPYDWWTLIRDLERVVERHPDTTFMGVHFGCAAEEIGYVADIMRQNPNYILDVSARLGEIGRHRADLVRDIFIEMQDRILFGTDLGVRGTLMLGAPQGFDPTEEDAEEFYDAHWEYFETDHEGIDHPTPIQGDWTVDAIDLPRDVLEKLYVDNAERYLGV